MSLYNGAEDSGYSKESSNKKFYNIIKAVESIIDIDIKDCILYDFGCGPCNLFKWFIDNNKIPFCYVGYDKRKESLEYAKNLYDSYNKFNIVNEKINSSLDLYDIAYKDKTPKHKIVTINIGSLVYKEDDLLFTDVDYIQNFSIIKKLKNISDISVHTFRKMGFENSNFGHKFITYSKSVLYEMGMGLSAGSRLELIDEKGLNEYILIIGGD